MYEFTFNFANTNLCDIFILQKVTYNALACAISVIDCTISNSVIYIEILPCVAPL